MSSIYRSLFAGLSLSVAAQFAGAGVISVESYGSGNTYDSDPAVSTVGDYTMTNFDLSGTAGDSISSIASPISGFLGFEDSNGNDVTLQKADSTGWWVNNGTTDENIYTTPTNQITITLPEKTLAFAFNVGASFNGFAWFEAYDETSAVQYNSGWFGVSPTNTPGFGVYADNSTASAGQCSYISKIVVDPYEGWGVGNFAIAQDAGNCSTEVPEPGSLALLGIGLIGLRLMRKKLS